MMLEKKGDTVVQSSGKRNERIKYSYDSGQNKIYFVEIIKNERNTKLVVCDNKKQWKMLP